MKLIAEEKQMAYKNAKDIDAAKFRYSHPYYWGKQYQTGNGYILFSVGGV